jgi:putative ABC transport system permease protein
MGDLKYALRQLVVHRNSSLVVIAMLALGVGSTTAVFSLFHDLVIQSLPVADPEQLVNLQAPGPNLGPTKCSTAGACDEIFSYPMFRDLEARQTTFTGIAAHRDFDADIVADDGTSAAKGIMVSGSYFGVLGLVPTLGRGIVTADDQGIGEARVVVLSHAFWLTAFGGDTAAIGRQLRVNGQELQIVGVAPRGFNGTTVGVQPAVFVPITLRWQMEPQRPADHTDRRSAWVYLFARLAPSVSLEQATAEINTLYTGILNELEAASVPPGTPPDLIEQFRARRVVLRPGAGGQSQVTSALAPPLTILLGATSLVLLIVCVNIANLLLARGMSRAGELAIRASIGASRGRLARQLLTEMMLLGAFGGLLSVPVATATLFALLAQFPTGVTQPVTLNATALWFAALTSIATTLLFGLAPLLDASRVQPGAVIKANAAQVAGRHKLLRFHGALATAQIALSTVLLVLAGLFTQSLANVARTDLGIEPSATIKFTVTPRRSGYSAERAMAFYEELERRLAAEPGVTNAAGARIALLTRRQWNSLPRFPDSEGVSREQIRAQTNEASPGFLATLSIPLLGGRDFTSADRLGAPNVAIVSEEFVRQFNLGDTPIGAQFDLDGRGRGIEIIGVMGDTKYSAVRDEFRPQILLAYRQDDNLDALTFYVRGNLEPAALLELAPRVVASIDSTLPVTNLLTLEREVQNNVFIDRLLTVLSASLAGLATLLAAVGLYSVLAYGVSRRRRELGLRLAMGARPRDLSTMVLKQVGVMAVIGGCIGLATAFAAGRAAESLLFGLSGSDVAVFIAAAAVLTAIVLAAGYLPARRAALTAPMESLRNE